MKIVKFENGQYGVRTFWLLGWIYLDLKTERGFTWHSWTYWFKDCKGTLEEAKKAIVNKNKIKLGRKSKHTVVE